MRPKSLLPLLAVILAASCTIEPSVNQVTMATGGTATITITQLRWFSGSFVPTGGVSVYSSDPRILILEQDPTLVSTSVFLRALRPGTAYIRTASTSQTLVTVQVNDVCTPVSVQAETSQIPALIGSLVELRVIPNGPYPIKTTWYEEKASGWSEIPSATGNLYDFVPQTSGTFRFMARYSDRCGEASTIITVVVASTRAVQPSLTAVSMLPGESTNITITRFGYLGEMIVPQGGVNVVSSDPSVLRLEQDPSLHSASVTLHALQPGMATIQTADTHQLLVTVDIASCTPVSVRPQVTQVAALVGSPVELHVFTDDPRIVATWYEEKQGGWSPIPFGTGTTYIFRPSTSGTFRFLVRYSDHCDDVSTLITVVVSTRARAVRH